MTNVSLILFNLFLATATIFIIVAIWALLRVLPRSVGGSQKDKEHTVAATPTGRETHGKEETDIETLTQYEEQVSGAAAETTEQPVRMDEFPYEQSGFYKWFNAQLRRRKDEKKG